MAQADQAHGEEDPLEDAVLLPDGVHESHVLLHAQLGSELRVAEESLATGNDFSPHEVVVHLYLTLLPCHNDEPIVGSNEKVLALHVCDAIGIFDELDLAEGEPVELEL